MDSVIFPTHDRDPLTLANTFRYLASQDLRDTELVIVDDRSATDLLSVLSIFEDAASVVDFRVVRVEDYEAYRAGGTGNDPAHAYNVGLSVCRGDRVFLMTDDVMLQPGALERGRKWIEAGYMFSPRIVDLGSSAIYCGRQRPFPMLWCLGIRREWIPDGGFDEEYLKGFYFSDNDFVGRVFKQVGRAVIDEAVTGWHQPNPRPMLADGAVGYETNRKYTEAKWGGIPFDVKKPAFQYQISEEASCVKLRLL